MRSEQVTVMVHGKSEGAALARVIRGGHVIAEVVRAPSGTRSAGWRAVDAALASAGIAVDPLSGSYIRTTSGGNVVRVDVALDWTRANGARS